MADIPSRFLEHPFLVNDRNVSCDANKCLEKFRKEIETVRQGVKRSGEGVNPCRPRVPKRNASAVASVSHASK